MTASTIDTPVTPESAALEALGTISAARCGLEARLIEAARLVVATTGAAVLAHKGFTDVEELTDGQRAKWRTETKRVACTEVETKLGMGVTEARHLVGLASAPVGVRSPVLEALDRGEVTWPMVRAFWRRCGALEMDDATIVADSLFGSDPETLVPERLGPDDELRDLPWHQADYTAALEREATRAEGEDAEAERERRRAAYRARRASLQVNDDGTATLMATGPILPMVAAHTRIERAARLLRKGGDPRTLDQLRADLVSALLVHGRLPLTEGSTVTAGNRAAPGAQTATGDHPGAADGDLLVPDLPELARVICGMPAVELQVVVPWDSLTGRAACPRCGRPPSDPPARACTPPPTSDAPSVDPEAPPVGSGAPPLGPAAPPASTAAPPDPGLGGVGFLLGAHPAFLAPSHLREMALLPGTTLSRLLTDPADGRLIERSIASYRPDAAMRRQVLAADVICRAPGSRQPASVCELDHVEPWSTDPGAGVTAETNLVALAKRPHDLKTRGLALSTINARRDLRWTTLLGQSRTTRVHDYRQYPHPVKPDRPDRGASDGAQHDASLVGQGGASDGEQRGADPVGGGTPEAMLEAVDRKAPLDAASGGEHPSQRSDLDDRRDLLNRAFYAALAHRGPDCLLAAGDDHPGSGEHGGPLAGWMWVTRTTPRGQRRHGHDPASPTVEDVLGLRAGPEAKDTEAGDDDGPRQADGRGPVPAPQQSDDRDDPPF